jgi:hypothetical protein
MGWIVAAIGADAEDMPQGAAEDFRRSRAVTCAAAETGWNS